MTNKNENNVFVVRVLWRGKADPSMIVGVVENASGESRQSFRNAEELVTILTARERPDYNSRA